VSAEAHLQLDITRLDEIDDQLFVYSLFFTKECPQQRPMIVSEVYEHVIVVEHEPGEASQSELGRNSINFTTFL